MDNYATLAEAASYLGVSKGTLRNWDRSGKLRAIRHPINNYRVYIVSELNQIQSQLSLLPLENDVGSSKECAMDVRAAKRLITRLHNILRDRDGNSNIMERFDELTKLLFLKIYIDQTAPNKNIIARLPGESDKQFILRLRETYNEISSKQPQIIPISFSKIKASDSALLECATALSLVSFVGANFDVKGLAYEEVIRHTFDKNDNQQFFTPPPIVRFMVDILGDRVRGAVCDPAAGTGGFLVQVAKSQCKYTSLTALEIDERLAWASGINMFTHGAQSIESKLLPSGGTLGQAAEPLFNRFDTIITNPPFGSEFSDVDTLSKYRLGHNRLSRRRGILFLERCYHMLKDKGTLGIILDEGVLSHPSSEDVRSFILDQFNILGIISLPENAFMPYATVNASILLLEKEKNRTKPRLPTFFAKPENVGRKPNGDDDYIYAEAGTPQLNSDLPEVIELYRTLRRGGSIEPTDLAYASEIRNNLEVEKSGLRLDFRYHHPAKHRSQEQLRYAAQRLRPLSDLCKEKNQTLIPSSELQDQTILYTGLAHIESGNGVVRQVPTPANSLRSAVKRYDPGDIVFAKMRPNLRKVALMNFIEGGYVSPECVVLTVNRSDGTPVIDPLLLSVLLRSDLVYGQIMHLVAGIGRPRLSGTDLRRVQIPLLPPVKQEGFRKRFTDELLTSYSLKSRAATLLHDASEIERRAIEHLANAFVDGV